MAPADDQFSRDDTTQAVPPDALANVQSALDRISAIHHHPPGTVNAADAMAAEALMHNNANTPAAGNANDLAATDPSSVQHNTHYGPGGVGPAGFSADTTAQMNREADFLREREEEHLRIHNAGLDQAHQQTVEQEFANTRHQHAKQQEEIHSQAEAQQLANTLALQLLENPHAQASGSAAPHLAGAAPAIATEAEAAREAQQATSTTAAGATGGATAAAQASVVTTNGAPQLTADQKAMYNGPLHDAILAGVTGDAMGSIKALGDAMGGKTTGTGSWDADLAAGKLDALYGTTGASGSASATATPAAAPTAATTQTTAATPRVTTSGGQDQMAELDKSLAAGALGPAILKAKAGDASGALEELSKAMSGQHASPFARAVIGHGSSVSSGGGLTNPANFLHISDSNGNVGVAERGQFSAFGQPSVTFQHYSEIHNLHSMSTAEVHGALQSGSMTATVRSNALANVAQAQQARLSLQAIHNRGEEAKLWAHKNELEKQKTGRNAQTVEKLNEKLNLTKDHRGQGHVGGW